MLRRFAHSFVAFVFLVILLPTAPTGAEVFKGVDFPQGAISFADAVEDYSPQVTTNGVSLHSLVQRPQQALGVPSTISTYEGFVSLGNGGSITLRFVDNALTGSGTSANDLWIFEIGPRVEDTYVAISEDGIDWVDVGKVYGSISGVDLDKFGYGPSARFHFVRLTDDEHENRDADDTSGADIDAVGAISTVLVDTTPPTIAAAVEHADGSPYVPGAWTNRPVTVSFHCEADDLDEESVSEPVTLGEGQDQSVAGTCADSNGNTATIEVGNIDIDLTAPDIVLGDRTPAANASGWSNNDVTVSWTCTDALSGPAEDSGTWTFTGEEADLGNAEPITCTDLAGNQAETLYPGINIDRTLPIITFTGVDPQPNSNGWNTGLVTLSWSCEDSGSGVLSGVVTQTIAAEGAGQAATGTCVDLAGYEVSDTQDGINIDGTAPVLTTPGDLVVTTPGPATGAVVDYAASALDAIAGELAVDCSLPSGSFFPLGTSTVSCTATDPAGNASSQSFTITVLTESPADKEQCKNGGWQGFNNPPYANQGQCVSSVASR